MRSQQHSLKEREEKLEELNKLKVDLMVAEEKVKVSFFLNIFFFSLLTKTKMEAKKNSESQTKMEELKKQVNEKEEQLKQVQEVRKKERKKWLLK